MRPVFQSKTCFSKNIEGLGNFELFPLDLDEHVPIIHNWVNQEYAEYWQMLDTTTEQVYEAYEYLLAQKDYYICMGYFEGEPCFLLECYHPKHVLSKFYNVEDSDCGMHILVAPPDKKIKSFTWNIFQTIMEFLFSDHRIQRVVVEPDVRNEKVHKLNRKAGFTRYKKIQLLEKEAYLEFCTREQFKNALQNQII
ncbi:acetyltransferase [Elizabethkingia anophelis]|uniref:GNAT family N-acetyltransferase n=1 Tax=Elizabethkingia TaxID=308865 RepID=UPI0007398F4E|nr:MULTISPECIES: GNAT family N-acetyltransferase [Elizabethkingia]KUF43035.1 hypothetical protein AS358_01830 [Elizabethkingia anophelis]MCT3645881.1 acetyltransferase [Elizabethkingia anophelis]MCT3653205.1 acetyltransferase [Elizabethkingia anophelis]MCT3657029.1 acetyltransferase [Elizabethkingia anophelis]MCT3660498.1 acetyltransferase [Elizabethkingia anophelis]